MRVAAGACTRLSTGVNIADVSAGRHLYRKEKGVATSISDGYSCLSTLGGFPHSYHHSISHIFGQIFISCYCLANTYGLGNGKEAIINLFPHKVDDVLAFGTTGARLEALDCLAAVQNNCLFCLTPLPVRI